MKIKLEFSGGLELLFDKTKNHLVEIHDKDKISLKDFLQWIKNNKLKERPELFVQDNSVSNIYLIRRPGILVLINDCDWELMGGIDYTVEDGDSLVFISTLHGG